MKISKTGVEAVSTYAKGLVIFAKDLMFNWDQITINSFKPVQFNAFYMQIFCILLLFLLLRFFIAHQNKHEVLVLQSKTIGVVSFAALAILLVTYLISAVLYANIIEYVVPRCKFVGCFFAFLALFDMAIILSAYFRGQKELHVLQNRQSQ